VKLFFTINVLLLISLCLSGCYVPYPEGSIEDAIIQLCKREYNIDVKTKLIGSSVGIYLPIVNLLDESYQLTEEASEKINDVVLTSSRAALNTEALDPDDKINFYIVIAQDPTLVDFEVVIIQYVNDIKMYRFNQIPRSEFFKRAVWELKPNPQAQKEKILKAIFAQLGVQESPELIDEFMTKDISTMGDIGYWNGEFFIKDITLEEFLAFQTAERIKRKFREDEELLEKFTINLVKARYLNEPAGRKFEFDLDVGIINEVALFISNRDKALIFEIALDIAGTVLSGYKFEDFDLVSVNMINELNSPGLVVTKAELGNLKEDKLEIGELIWKR